MATPVLSKVAEFVSSGDWHEAHGRPEFTPHVKIKDELSVNSEQNVVLRGTKIVLTLALLALADDVLKILHESHLGFVLSKRLLRTKLYFPGMNKKVEEMARQCILCQANTIQPSAIEPVKMNKKVEEMARQCILCQANTIQSSTMVPLKMSPLPTEVFSELSCDFLGPLPGTGKYLCATIDDYSRFP